MHKSKFRKGHTEKCVP